MSFRDFTFPKVCSDLGLTFEKGTIFAGLKPVPLREDVRTKLEWGLELSQGLNNEKARSEFVIAPLLVEIWREAGKRFGLFSGCELNVDPASGLNGVCDFLFARDPLIYILKAPIMAVVEAKNDNVWNGFGQCIATMRAAALFNERAGLPSAPIFGTSTTGLQWKFFRLDGNTVTLDVPDYLLMSDADRIASILLHVVGE